jgi:mono/diheme cytochrome c family protein
MGVNLRSKAFRRKVIYGGLGLALLVLPSQCLADGKQIFVNKCGSCHGTGKEAASINPGNMASSQWENYFKRNKHKRKKDISGVVSDADIEQILKYLMQNAADSDYPEIAAIP